MWNLLDEIKYRLEMLGYVLLAFGGILLIFSPFIIIGLITYYLIFQPEAVGEFIGNWIDKFQQGIKN